MTDDITQALARAKQLELAATPGPWSVEGGQVISDAPIEANIVCIKPEAMCKASLGFWKAGTARFIAESRTLLPQMVAEVERLRAVPDWRPLSVLTRKVAECWKTWAFRPMEKTGEDQFPMMVRVSVYQVPEEELQTDAECRPVDREGVPVPWSEVGL